MLLRLVVVIAVIGSCLGFSRVSPLTKQSSLKARSLTPLNFSPNELIDPVQHAAQHMDMHGNDMSSMLISAEAAVSAYSKVDKTGFIGFIATYVEVAIDAFHGGLTGVGIQNSYGYAIMAFTLLVKLVTLPLTQTQLQSTTMMQKMAPLQKTIQEKYANDEQTKNQLVAQLFQAANINPLAGCFPALVQLPIFISLYRALQNLVAENKLAESFLWIPDLEGPVFSAGPGASMDWIKSIFSGAPVLGWHDTLCYLSLPVILFVSQSFSTKILQPPRDPNKPLTDQEQFSQNLVNNLPFIVAFFSLNVPSGLGVYWIVNNVITTGVTLAVKRQFKDQELPMEAVQFMAQIEADSPRSGAMPGARQRVSSGMDELRSALPQAEMKPKEGFGAGSTASTASVSQAIGSSASEEAKDAAETRMDPPSSSSSSSSTQPTAAISVERVAEPGVVAGQAVESAVGVGASASEPKRKKRVKPAQRKKK
jgi:YidC/Oxa1 family membrane protein insertase